MENLEKIKNNDVKITKKQNTEIVKKDKAMRDSNIELLRIISMIFIILHHISCYTNLSKDNTLLNSIFIPLGGFGNNIFVLISGYYLINKKFSIKKLLKLWAEVFFYSASITCILTIFLPQIKIDITSFFPIITSRYGFITSYFLMYILSPFMNNAIKKASKKSLDSFMIIIILISCLCSLTCISSVVYGVSKFVILYFIGAYIRLYGINYLENKSKVKLSTYMLIVTFAYFAIYTLYYKKIILIFYTREMQIFILINTILIFYLFKNIKLENNIIINYIGKCSLAVFLIHEHSVVRYLLWGVIFFDIGQNLSYFILAVVGLWVIAILCELIRNIIDKIVFNKKTNELISKIDSKLEKYFVID